MIARLLLTLLPLALFSYSGEFSLGYDFFRSIPEGDWAGNTGSFVSFNGNTNCKGVDLQLGSSYGLYDWSGKGSAPSSRQTRVQQQLFATAGLSKCFSCFNAGLVYDWMWNKGFGVFGVQTSFGQLRGQAGYTLNRCNELGLWGTLDLNRSHRRSQNLPVTFRALSQINAYWKHLFSNCAEVMVWAGVPYKRSLSFSTGRAGKALFGASFHAPLNDTLSFDGHAMYMIPHSAAGSLKQRYYGANLCLELKYSFGCDRPYMPLANNSNFIADTSVTF